MAKSVEVTRTTRGALDGSQAEELFGTVDETGHTNEARAKKQHSRRREEGASVQVDPLAGDDPSGANTDRVITRSAILFVTIFLVIVVVMQVGWGYVRRITTATLAEDASMRSVVSALGMGVEWGGGFTQFPAEFTVQEADENTHRIEVTVTDSSSSNDLDAFSTAQVQASAIAVNALLNPNIDTVVYHVRVRRDSAGRFQRTRFFGFLRPTGAATPFMTFVWTKTTAEEGVRFDCSITGMDSATQENLHAAITSKSTPATFINYVMGDSSAETAQRVIDSTQDNEALKENILAMKRETEREKARSTVEENVSQQVEQMRAAENAPEDQADEATDELATSDSDAKDPQQTAGKDETSN